MKKNNKWKTIADNKVQHVWVCNDEDCPDNGVEVVVGPDFYAGSGTPVCSCGNDMRYVRTEVLI